MSVRTYSTNEICPNCHVNIFETLCDHVFTEGGAPFDIECPSCNTMLSIVVEPVPAFSIQRDGAVQHSVQSDGLQCTACGTRFDIGGHCPKCSPHLIACR